MRVDTIFCDDIRPETSGKHILIGAYANDLVANGKPANFTLSMWIKVTDADRASKSAVINVRTDDGVVQISVVAEIVDPKLSETTVFVLQGFPVSINSDTVLRATLTIDDDEPLQIGRLPMKVSGS